MTQLIIAISIILFLILFLVAPIALTRGHFHSIHKEMVQEDTKEWGYGTWKDFKREFDNRRWERSETFPESFFGEDYPNNQIHASIISFDGKGMVLDYWSWVRLCWFLKRNNFNVNKKATVNWKA